MERRGNEGNLITVNLSGSDDSKLPALRQGDVVEVIDGDNDHSVEYNCRVFSSIIGGARAFEADRVRIMHGGDAERIEDYGGMRRLDIIPSRVVLRRVCYEWES